MTVIQEILGYKNVIKDGAVEKRIVPNVIAANVAYGAAGAFVESKSESFASTIAKLFGMHIR